MLLLQFYLSTPPSFSLSLSLSLSLSFFFFSLSLSFSRGIEFMIHVFQDKGDEYIKNEDERLGRILGKCYCERERERGGGGEKRESVYVYFLKLMKEKYSSMNFVLSKLYGVRYSLHFLCTLANTNNFKSIISMIIYLTFVLQVHSQTE